VTKERKDQYQTLLVICIGFALLAWRFHRLWLAAVAGIILICGLISPYLLRKINAAWLWIGEAIGAVMSRVILSIVFILFLTPIALLFRLFKKKDNPAGHSSFFIERNHTYATADLEKVF
jgi:hypothetical protein